MRQADRPAAARTREDFKQSYLPILRGTAIGAILGILPGNGAVLGPFASYTVEKKLAKDPEPLRPRRHRGRGRAGGRQQRRRADRRSFRC